MKLEVFENISSEKNFLAVVGLGYVGLPLAVGFAEKVKTIGFDIDREKIEIYKSGVDPTFEVGDEKIRNTTIEFTSDPQRLKEAKMIIVAVPTPLNGDKTPDLSPVVTASEIVGQNLTKGSIVVFESTVYPGVTEDICIPVLEKSSGLTCGIHFKVGYSPERINPGDKINRLATITKIVAGIDEETVSSIAAIYEMIIEAGVYKASSIKVAEAAKLAENSQRDINIAFMNELAMFFDREGIKTKDVVEAMNTKWNALGFYPGLVGGHCIGVDPYYFIYRAQVLGYQSKIISASRRINDYMVKFATDKIIKKLINARKDVRNSIVYVMGITFKENCPDMRNSKAVEICRELAEFGMELKIVDPVADRREFRNHFGMEITRLEDVRDADCLIFLVAHLEFRNLLPEQLAAMFKPPDGQTENIIIDVKSIFDQKILEEKGYSYWSL